MYWKYLLVISLFLFPGCGDLEPEMQDTRTVILNMDFNERTSSRTSSNVSESELDQYNTHLILAVPSQVSLTSNYLSYFYSSLDAGLMNPQERRVNLEIPLNIGIKVFAFLLQGNYNMDELIQSRQVGYYGQSGIFYINNQTNNLNLGITLQSAGNSSGGGNSGTNTASIEEVAAIGTTSNPTPNYTFASTIAGTISYGGPCSSTTTSAIIGNNTITFRALENGTFTNCTIKVTDSTGNESNIITVTTFTILDTTLLAHYKFEGNLNDSSSYGRDLTEQGTNITYTSTDNQSNKSGQAAWFNGTNTYAFTNNITVGDNFTIAFWTKPESVGQYDSVLSTGDSNSTNGIFQIEYKVSNQIQWRVAGGSSLSSSLLMNEWNHIVITKSDNATDDKKVYIYKDGSYINSVSGQTTRWDKIKIGLNRNGMSHWQGLIDEIKIHNKTFTANEVLSLFQSY